MTEYGHHFEQIREHFDAVTVDVYPHTAHIGEFRYSTSPIPQTRPLSAKEVDLVIRIDGYPDDPVRARAFWSAEKVSTLLDGDDRNEPDADTSCTIGLDYQREHSAREVAREVWRRLDVPSPANDSLDCLQL